MSSHKRNYNKWTIPETLQLQREYELLQWSIDQISEKHQRTPNAIMYKLDKEGFADYNRLWDIYNDTHRTNTNLKQFENESWYQDNSSDEEEDEENKLEYESELIRQLQDQLKLAKARAKSAAYAKKLFK